MASGTLCYDLSEKKWINEYIEHASLSKDIFPEIKTYGETAGKISKEAAEETGLAEGMPVIIGAQDQRCASLGAGIGSGVFTVSLGTASAICALIDKPLFDPDFKVTCCGLDSEHWVLEYVVNCAGASYKWIKNTFFDNISYKEMDKLAEEAPIGSNGVRFLPELNITDSCGNGMGSFKGLSLSVGKADIIRSVLEGVAVQIADGVSMIEKMGIACKELRVFGGGANSDVWCRIIADISGKKVSVPRTNETGNLGAALIAGKGVGILREQDDQDAFIGASIKSYLPDMTAFAEYNHLRGK